MGAPQLEVEPGGRNRPPGKERGRAGRALDHAVLVRRGLTRHEVLPISPVLLTRSGAYVEGLTAYRYNGPASGTDGQHGIRAARAGGRCPSTRC